MAYKLTQGWPTHIETGAAVNPESNTEYLAWLAEGNTPEPADPPVRDIKAEIDQMERATMIPRAVREFMLGYMESQFTPEQLAANPGYTKVKAFDAEVATLRSEINS